MPTPWPFAALPRSIPAPATRWLPWLAVILLLLAGWVGCMAKYARPGQPLARQGDEIVVCGRFFHTGAPVVLWLDPGGYDAYRIDPRFAPRTAPAPSTQNQTQPSPGARYGLRGDREDSIVKQMLGPEGNQRIQDVGWDLPTLQGVVDQFVIHYDAAGTSRQCFRVLHDQRILSAHFLLDLDGTIYQTLDLKERAWHATTANDRSIGIEIAHVGAFPDGRPSPMPRWYAPDTAGRVRITIPRALGDAGIRTRNFVARPARPEPIIGIIQNKTLQQYDFTPEQYESLAKLTATLCQIFPNLRCDYPRDEQGKLIREKLPDQALANFQGLLGHYHVQANKIDPGPAFDWDYLIHRTRKLMRK